MIFELYCYLALCARCMWTDRHFCTWYWGRWSCNICADNTI